MGFDTSNLPYWWVETQNNVKASFFILVALSIVSIFHYYIIMMTILKPAIYPPDKIKSLTKPFLYYQLSMVAVYFSSNMYTSFFAWGLMFFWFKIHLMFSKEGEDAEHQFDKYWRWMNVLQFFFWWGVLIGFFFEFARP